MKKKTVDTRYMATLAMLCGVLLVMGMTGIGFIPLPVIKATTMHIPVILCGLICGGESGATVGFIMPLMRSLSFTMPPMFPTAIAMAFELAA